MKKLLTILFILISFSTSAQWNQNNLLKYVWYKNIYGNRFPRLKLDSVLMHPNDTSYSKDGSAIKGNMLYIGNGNYWTAIGGTGSGSISVSTNSYLIRTSGVGVSGTTLTVTAPIYWVYRGADSSELSNQVFTISTASAGDVRTDIIWIDSLGVFRKTAGTPDSAIAVAPQIDYNGIVVAYANIDGSTITTTPVSTFQGNGVVFTQGVGVNNGQAETDSANFSYDETTRNLTLTGKYISNTVGGVAYQLLGGSAVRAFQGNGRLYLDGYNDNTQSSVYLRTGATYQHITALNNTGQFWVGSSASTPDASAKIDVSSTTQGALLPRMTTAQRLAISSPANGLLVYDNELNSLFQYNGSDWQNLYNTGGGGSTDTTGIRAQINAGYGITKTGTYPTVNLAVDTTTWPTAVSTDGTVLITYDDGLIDFSVNHEIAPFSLQDARDFDSTANPQINIIESGDEKRKMMQSQYFGQDVSFGFDSGTAFLENKNTSDGSSTLIRADATTAYMSAEDSINAISSQFGVKNDQIEGRTNNFCLYNGDSATKVGINTAVPLARLHVVGATIISSIASGGTITSSGDATLAVGRADNNGSITSSGAGSFAGGHATDGVISSTSDGSFAFGLAQRNTATISATQAGALAFGYANDRGKILATGSGSFAGGSAGNLDNLVEATSEGSFAWGATTSSNSDTVRTDAEHGVTFGNDRLGSIYNVGAGSFTIGTGFTNETPDALVVGYGARKFMTGKDSSSFYSNLKVYGNTTFAANGTPASGKVATATDGNGNWTWQTPAASGITTSQLTDSLNSRHSKIYSGTYQPTITGVANLVSVSISRCLYQRISDSTATVSGEITFQPTSSSGTLCRAIFTLPISSDLNASWQCNGLMTVNATSTAPVTGAIDANTTNDQAEMRFPANFNGVSVTAKFSLTYYIR